MREQILLHYMDRIFGDDLPVNQLRNFHEPIFIRRLNNKTVEMLTLTFDKELDGNDLHNLWEE